MKSRSEGRSHPHWRGQVSLGGEAVRGARGRGVGGRWFDGPRRRLVQSVRVRERTLQDGHFAQVILVMDWPTHNTDMSVKEGFSKSRAWSGCRKLRKAG